MKNFLRAGRALFYKYAYKNPAKNMHIIGITGTDGKSTTSEMLYQLLHASGKSVGMISTIGGKINDVPFSIPLHASTPSSKLIYKKLAEMKDLGVEYCVLELTSHGLSQKRAFGIHLDGAIFTNITPEHLDYHKTFERYREAKASIMKMIKKDGFVILNKDDDNFTYLVQYAQKYLLHISAYSQLAFKKESVVEKQYFAEEIEEIEDGFLLTIHMSHLKFPIELHLHGKYNISNALGAIAAAINLEMPLHGVVKGIGAMRNIKGRMEYIQTHPFTVIIDFAHTPNAYKNLIPMLKEKTKKGKLILVFGCAGKRDKQKRSEMGNIASHYADAIILTAEDPRDESVEEINKNIMEKMDHRMILHKNLFSIESREEAIAYALTKLVQDGDTVAFLGKGHEQSNCVGDIEYPWNEEEIVKKYLI